MTYQSSAATSRNAEATLPCRAGHPRMCAVHLPAKGGVLDRRRRSHGRPRVDPTHGDAMRARSAAPHALAAAAVLVRPSRHGTWPRCPARSMAPARPIDGTPTSARRRGVAARAATPLRRTRLVARAARCAGRRTPRRTRTWAAVPTIDRYHDDPGVRDDDPHEDRSVGGALIAKNPLFSTYRQDENRVTSSMLAVFERIDLSLLETILAASAGESSLQMVTFTTQPSSKGRSVPDVRISARFAYWFEVKTARNALGARQLAEHLANLGDEGGAERLFVITPDAEQPDAIAAVGDPRVVWFNFRSLYD